MTDRGTCWSVTLNNPTRQDEECIALARQKGWSVEGQLEKGKEGTPHYQLMVKTPQVRFSAVKKAFPRAHIELARNRAALAAYVTKEETRERTLSLSQEMYPSLSKFWDLLYDELAEILHYPPEEYDWYNIKNEAEGKIAYYKAVRELITKGYHVETLAVNPSTLSAFTKFSKEIMFRSWRQFQTDRQNALESQEANVPTFINADYDETPSCGGSSCGSSASP